MADTWDSKKVEQNFNAVTQKRIDLSAIETVQSEFVKNLKNAEQMFGNLPLDKIGKEVEAAQASMTAEIAKVQQLMSNPVNSPFAKIDVAMAAGAKALSEIDTDAVVGKLSEAAKLGVGELEKQLPAALEGMNGAIGELGDKLGGMIDLKNITGDLTKIVGDLNLPEKLVNVEELLSKVGTPEFQIQIDGLKNIPNIDLKAVEQLAEMGPRLAKLNLGDLTGKLQDLNPQKLIDDAFGDIQGKMKNVAETIGKLDIASVTGSLLPQLQSMQANFAGLLDANRATFEDTANQLKGVVEHISSDFKNLNARNLKEAVNLMDNAKGTLVDLTTELEKQGHIVRGKTVSGITTVPSAIQSTKVKPGVRTSTGKSTNVQSTDSTSPAAGGKGADQDSGWTKIIVNGVELEVGNDYVREGGQYKTFSGDSARKYAKSKTWIMPTTAICQAIAKQARIIPMPTQPQYDPKSRFYPNGDAAYHTQQIFQLTGGGFPSGLVLGHKKDVVDNINSTGTCLWGGAIKGGGFLQGGGCPHGGDHEDYSQGLRPVRMPGGSTASQTSGGGGEAGGQPAAAGTGQGGAGTEKYSLDGEIVPSHLRKNGKLDGTKVVSANPNPQSIPRQEVIDALDNACKELGIGVIITPGGGWAARSDARTLHHPNGFAADVHVLVNGRILRCTTKYSEGIELYRKLAVSLQKYAKNTIGKTPGLAIYFGEKNGFLHFDVTPDELTVQVYGSSKRPANHRYVFWKRDVKSMDQLPEFLGPEV